MDHKFKPGDVIVHIELGDVYTVEGAVDGPDKNRFRWEIDDNGVSFVPVEKCYLVCGRGEDFLSFIEFKHEHLFRLAQHVAQDGAI